MLEPRFIHDVRSIVRDGKPVRIRKFDSSHYASKVPESLAVIWQEFGVSSWGGGAFQICDPSVFESAIATIFEGNRLIRPDDVMPFIISAFGIVKAWHFQFGVFEIQFPLSRVVFPRSPAELLAKKPGDANLIARFPVSSKDFPVIAGFEKAVRTLGILQENEVYAFFPMFSINKNLDEAVLKKVSADVHIDLIANAQPFDFLYFGAGGYEAWPND